MATYPTYKKQKNGLPDVYIYDKIPQALKNQIYHICNDFLFQERIPIHRRDEYFSEVYKCIVKENGLRALPQSPFAVRSETLDIIFNYFNNLTDVDDALSVIQIVFDWFDALERTIQNELPMMKLVPSVKESIEELNDRFKENGVGYQYSNLNIIRLDNENLHNETIRETLRLITEQGYKEINDEFMKALDHFRKSNYQDCINWCGKAFESTMKIICKQNAWAYGEKDTASPLIAILIKNKFLPQYYENSLTGIRLFLDNSIPTIRNKNEAAHSKVKHPDNSNNIDIPQTNLVRYMIYITGSTIRFLIEAQQSRT